MTTGRHDIQQGGGAEVRRVWRHGIIAAVVWTLMVAASVQWTMAEHHQHLVRLAQVWAETAFEQDVQYWMWNVRHGGVYAQVDRDTQPDPYLRHFAERDIVTPSGRHLTLINPSYMTRQVFNVARERGAVLGHVTSLKPLDPANKPDAWEKKGLLQFAQGAKVAKATVTLDGKRYYRFMRPLLVQQSCLKCHANQGYHVGDVRGAISVAVPMPRAFAADARFSGLLLGFGALWLLGLGGIGAATASLAQRTRRLVQTNDRLQGEVEMRRETEAELRHEHDEQRSLIARLEQTQQQLLQSEKMAAIGQLAAGVAHEINNPTGYVLSNLATLQRYLEDVVKLLNAYEQCETSLDGQAGEWLQQILALKKSLDIDYIKSDVVDLLRESSEGMNRVRKIVQDLKDFSHPDSGEWQWADLRANIESTLNVVWNELKYRTEVVKEFGDTPLVYCIPSQINQVTMNLLTNAVQAIPERGTITIRTGCTDDEAWFSISDTGSGISPEHLQRIFDPFFTTKPVGKGTGLGLSLSFGIVQRHGGRIDVDSEPGKGTTFRVWLPLRGGGEAPPPAEDQHAT